MQKELEELKKERPKAKKDEKKEYEYIYNKYTATDYNVTFIPHMIGMQRLFDQYVWV